MSAHDDFDAYLKLVKGGMTAGREQIYNFLKFDQLVPVSKFTAILLITLVLKLLQPTNSWCKYICYLE